MKVSTDSIYKNCIIKKKNLVNNSRKRTKHSAVSEEFDFGRMQVEGVNIVSLWLCGKRELSSHCGYSFRSTDLLAKGGRDET